MLDESPAVVVVDQEGNIVQVHERGNLHQLAVTDNKALDLLEGIHLTLKQIEFHLRLITEVNILPEETEDHQ